MADTIQGTIVLADSNESPAEYRILVFPANKLGPDNLIGEGITNSNGRFKITYRRTPEVARLRELFPTRGPTLVLLVYDPKKNLVHQTPPRRGAKRFEAYNIALDATNPDAPDPRVQKRFDQLRNDLRIVLRYKASKQKDGSGGIIDLQDLSLTADERKKLGISEDRIKEFEVVESLSRVFPADATVTLVASGVDSLAALQSWTEAEFKKSLSVAGIHHTELPREIKRFQLLKALPADTADKDPLLGLFVDIGGDDAFASSDKANLSQAGVRTLSDWAKRRHRVKLSERARERLASQARLKSLGFVGQEADSLIQSNILSAADLASINADQVTTIARNLGITIKDVVQLAMRARNYLDILTGAAESTISQSDYALPQWLKPSIGQSLSCIPCQPDSSALSKFAYFIYLVQTTRRPLVKLEDVLHQKLSELSPANAYDTIPQIKICTEVLARAFPTPLTHDQRLGYERFLLARKLAFVPLSIAAFAAQVARRFRSVPVESLAERLREATTAAVLTDAPTFTAEELEAAKRLVEEHLLVRGIPFLAITPREIVEAAFASQPPSRHPETTKRLELLIAKGPDNPTYALKPFELDELEALNGTIREYLSDQGKARLDATLKHAELEACVALRDAYKRRAKKTDIELFADLFIETNLAPCESTTRVEQAIRSLQAFLDALQKDAETSTQGTQFAYLNYPTWRAQRMSELYPDVGALLRNDVLTGDDGPFIRGSIFQGRANDRERLSAELEQVQDALEAARVANNLTPIESIDRETFNDLARFSRTALFQDFRDGLTAMRAVLATDEHIQQAIDALDSREPGRAIGLLAEAEADLKAMSAIVFVETSPWSVLTNRDITAHEPSRRKQILQEMFAELTSGRKRLFGDAEQNVQISGVNPFTLQLEEDNGWTAEEGFDFDDQSDPASPILLKQQGGSPTQSDVRNYREFRYQPDDQQLRNLLDYSIAVDFKFAAARDFPLEDEASLGIGVRMSDGKGYRVVINQVTNFTEETGHTREFYLTLEKFHKEGAVEELKKKALGPDNADSVFAHPENTTYGLEVTAQGDVIRAHFLVRSSNQGLSQRSFSVQAQVDDVEPGTFAILATDIIAVAFTRIQIDAFRFNAFRPFYASRRIDRFQQIAAKTYIQHRFTGAGMAQNLVGLAGLLTETRPRIGSSDLEGREDRLVFGEEIPVVRINNLDLLLEELLAMAFYFRFASIPTRLAQAHLLSGDFEKAITALSLVYDETASIHDEPSSTPFGPGDHRVIYPFFQQLPTISVQQDQLPVVVPVSHDVSLYRMRVGEILLAHAHWLFRQNTPESRYHARRLCERILILHGRKDCGCSPSIGTLREFIKEDLIYNATHPTQPDFNVNPDLLDLLKDLYDLQVSGIDENTVAGLVSEAAQKDHEERSRFLKDRLNSLLTANRNDIGRIATMGRLVDQASDRVREAELDFVAVEDEQRADSLLQLTAAHRPGFDFGKIGHNGRARTGETFANDPFRFPSKPTMPGGQFFLWASYSFCIPPRPIQTEQVREACIMLDHLQHCRNSLGYTKDFFPPLRFEALLQIARSFADLALAAERDFLNFKDRFEQESFSLLQADHALAVNAATVGIEATRLETSRTDAAIAGLQLSQARDAVQHYEDLIQEGLNYWENKALASAEAALEFQRISAVAGPLGLIGQAAVGAAAGNPLTLASAAAEIVRSVPSSVSGIFSAESQLASMRAGFERRSEEWRQQRDQSRFGAAIALENVTRAASMVGIAEQQLDLARLNQDFAGDSVNFLHDKFLNAAMWYWMEYTVQKEYKRRLNYAVEAAFMAERALGFEIQDTSLGVVRFDYFDPAKEGLLGATQLRTDLATLENIKLKSMQRKLQISKTISLVQTMPADFQSLRETGRLIFRTPMELFDRDYPGHYLRLIKNVKLMVLALVPPHDGIHATLKTDGVSDVVVGPPFSDTFKTETILRNPESIALSAPFQDDGLFVLDYRDALLLPFEGMGVDTQWILELPKSTNRFNFATIADVLVTIDYTALQNDLYRGQVIAQLGDTFSADILLSLQFQYPDQLYHLHNPTDASRAQQVKLDVTENALPPNIIRGPDAADGLQPPRLQHVTIALTGQNGRTPATPQPSDGEPLIALRKGNTHIDVRENQLNENGYFSTRLFPSQSPIGDSVEPSGEWTLELNENFYREENGSRPIDQINDILVVLTVEGQVAW